MTAMFDRKVFFDSVRNSLFGGKLTQQQVDGMEYKLSVWEANPISIDLRHLSYPLATSKLETASTMWPIEEYGKGKGRPYGVRDPETGQIYYGRGDVQLTWRENYARVDREFGFTGNRRLEWNADRALDPAVSAAVMFLGMKDGWFRGDDKGRQTLQRYFSVAVNDPFGAREIINGDKNRVPNWSDKNIGTIIAEYHENFLSALKASLIQDTTPELPEVVTVNIDVPKNVVVQVLINGVEL